MAILSGYHCRNCPSYHRYVLIRIHRPETKNKTLEEIDILFSQPTSELVKENLKNVTQTTSDLLHLRWRKVFSPSAESEVPEKRGGEGIEPISEKVQG